METRRRRDTGTRSHGAHVLNVPPAIGHASRPKTCRQECGHGTLRACATLDLRFPIALAHPFYKRWRNAHGGQAALADESPIGEKAAVLDLAQGGMDAQALWENED